MSCRNVEIPDNVNDPMPYSYWQAIRDDFLRDMGFVETSGAWRHTGPWKDDPDLWKKLHPGDSFFHNEVD